MTLRVKIPQLCRSALHTERQCLFHRIRLEIQRRIQERLSWARPRMPGPQTIADSVPAPIFPPRTALAGSSSGGCFAYFLNQEWPLQRPINWRPECTQLATMNLHYMEYLEGLDPEVVNTLVSDWIKENPAFSRGYWRDRWNSYALSLRCMVWMQEVARDRLKADEKVLGSLCQQICFLISNLELDIRGNHLIKNIKTLLWGASFFKSLEAASWRELGIRLLEEELPRQILADGVHYERSPAYHLQVFADLLECYSVLPDHPVKAILGDALDRMAQVAADLTHPDGLTSLFNDGGLHMAYPPEVCLDAYTRLRSREVATRPCFSFPDAGYFGVRDRGDYLLVDCGSIAPDSLPAHGHGDILSFEWTLSERRCVVDTGVYEYREGPRRIQSRATVSHNTVTLDGLDQCEFWKSFRVGRRARVTLHHHESDGTHFRLEGSHDGYAYLPGKPIHRRSFDASPSRISVEDSIQGGTGQKVEARVLFHPDVRIVRTGEKTCMLLLGDDKIMLEASHPLRIEDTSWFSDFGVEAKTRRVVLEYGTAPCQGRYTLAKD